MGVLGFHAHCAGVVSCGWTFCARLNALGQLWGNTDPPLLAPDKAGSAARNDGDGDTWT